MAGVAGPSGKEFFLKDFTNDSSPSGGLPVVPGKRLSAIRSRQQSIEMSGLARSYGNEGDSIRGWSADDAGTLLRGTCDFPAFVAAPGCVLDVQSRLEWLSCCDVQ